MNAIQITMAVIGAAAFSVAETVGVDTQDLRNPAAVAEFGSFKHLLRIEVRDETGNRHWCLTDGLFCIKRDSSTVFKWGYLEGIDPATVTWTGQGELIAASAEYDRHCWTIHVGESASSALRKIGTSNLIDVTAAISTTIKPEPWFRLYWSKYYQNDDGTTFLLEYANRDNQLVVARIHVIPKGTFSNTNKGYALDSWKQVSLVSIQPKKSVRQELNSK